MVFNYAESCDQDSQKDNRHLQCNQHQLLLHDGSFFTLDEDSLLFSKYKLKKRFLNSLFDFHYVNIAVGYQYKNY